MTDKNNNTDISSKLNMLTAAAKIRRSKFSPDYADLKDNNPPLVKVIFGNKPNSQTGKSFLVSSIMAGYDRPVILDAKSLNPCCNFNFMAVTELTDIIIVENVGLNDLDRIETLVYSNKIRIEKRGESPKNITKPRIILVLDCHPSVLFKEFRISLTARCQFIETSIDSTESEQIIFNWRIVEANESSQA